MKQAQNISTIMVEISNIEDGNVYFYHDGKLVFITMRQTLQRARPGMTMEVDYDCSNYDRGPIKGARLVHEVKE